MKLSAIALAATLATPATASNNCFGLADFNQYVYSEGGQLYAIGDTQGAQTQIWTFDDGRFAVTHSPTPSIVCLVVGGNDFTVVANQKPNL